MEDVSREERPQGAAVDDRVEPQHLGRTVASDNDTLHMMVTFPPLKPSPPPRELALPAPASATEVTERLIGYQASCELK